MTTDKTPFAKSDTTNASLFRELAKKHGVSEAAVAELHAALTRGGGRMAQFNHPDLGGQGQWMASGMIMVGDMFNDALKAKVGALCEALVPTLGAGSPASAPSESPSGRAASSSWWPAEFTSPAATGGQNDFRYAYFPRDNALVLERAGKIETYDTTGHDLHGFGQQQSSSSGFTLHSARGPIDVTQFPRKASGGLGKKGG